MKDHIIVAISLILGIVISGLCFLIVHVNPVTVKKQYYVFELGEEIPTNVDYYISANQEVLKEAQLNLVEVKQAIGDYPVTLTYLDHEYAFYIRIKDTQAPTASLVQVKYDIFIHDTLNAMDMIKDIEDKTEVIAYFESDDKVASRTYSKPGAYNERIVVEDTSGNKLFFRVRVNVKLDRESPVIYGVVDKKVELGKPFKYFEGIRAVDNRDEDISDRISVDGHVDIHTLGTYTLTYYVSDNAGNRTIQKCEITVVESLDDEAPAN